MREHAGLAAIDAEEYRPTRERGDHRGGLGNRLSDRAGDLHAARLRRCLCLGRGIGADHAIARGGKVGCHRATHVAEPDKGNGGARGIGALMLSLLVRGC